MKIKYIIMGVVIVSLLVILFLPGGEVFTGEPGTIDCGSDMVCFMNAGENCTKAKVLTNSSGNMMAMEMLGEQNDRCIMTMEIVDVNTDAPGFALYSDSVKGSTLQWKEKSMKCALPMGYSDYENVTNSLDFCEGDLKDAIDDTLSLLAAEVTKIASISPACIPQTLWDTMDSSYSVIGVAAREGRDVCKAVYSFGTMEDGTFTITHWFNLTGEQVEVGYSEGPARTGRIAEWCQGPGWDIRGSTGTATASAAEIIENNGEQFCHRHFILLPASEYLPGISTDVYLDNATQTAIRIKTTMGNTIERVYGV